MPAIHNDDKSPLYVPYVKKCSGSPLEKYTVDIHGEFCLLSHSASGYFSEPGLGSKGTNFTLDLILLNILARKRQGQKVQPFFAVCVRCFAISVMFLLFVQVGSFEGSAPGFRGSR